MQIKLIFPIQTIEPHASQLLTHTEFICDAAKVGQKAIPRPGKKWKRPIHKPMGAMAEILQNISHFHEEHAVIPGATLWRWFET